MFVIGGLIRLRLQVEAHVAMVMLMLEIWRVRNVVCT